MFQKLLNNIFFNKIFIFLNLDKYFQRANSYWIKYETKGNKSHQEIAGYSHSKDVQETVDKTHLIIRQTVSTYITSNSNILDIGCGPGLYLKDFDVSMKLYGIDLSKGMLELAKSNCPKAILINDEFLKYNFKIKFDLIYSVGVLQYISKSEIDFFFKKIAELLTTNGFALISYPHAISEKDLSIPDINYINYSPAFLNTIATKYLNLIQNKHIIDDKEIVDYDRTPYKPINPNFDKTYRNSSILIVQKK